MKFWKHLLRGFGIWFCSTLLLYFLAVAIFPIDANNILLIPDGYMALLILAPIVLGCLCAKFLPSKKLSTLFSPRNTSDQISTLPNSVGYAVSWGDPSTPPPSPFVVPSSKKKQQALAQSLLRSATMDNKAANEAEYVRSFISYYMSTMEKLHELELLKKAPVLFNGEMPSTACCRLEREFQWHLRDAIEREYKSIINGAKTTYRNNHSAVESYCSIFKDEIEICNDLFDEETSAFSKDILRKLFRECHVELSESCTANETIPLCEMNFDSMGGHEFEFFCAAVLRGNGFSNVDVTRSSGDQGVDILAEKDGIKYAVQCKCYSSDVGNKPVQEVNAGKAIYQCQIGVVMTNRYFTQGAKEAASATGTLLWDRDALFSMIKSSAQSK